MYLPPAFAAHDRTLLRAFVRAHPLGLLITQGNEGPIANPLPFELIDGAGPPNESDHADEAVHGVLRAHMARANPQWRMALDGGCDALVVFQGPQHYVSPGWYRSKAEHGRVVPTWNYQLVQARGRMRVCEDAVWLRTQVASLTARHEQGAHGWTVEEAPADFIAAQLRAIVGVEIEVSALVGKFKLSQNRSDADRQAVEAALRDAGATMVADAMGATRKASRDGEI